MEKLEAVKRCRDLISGLQVAMLTRVGANGTLRSRPMAMLDIDDEGTVWAFFKRDPEFTFPVGANPHASVCVFDADSGRYISISGVVELLDDPGREHDLWTPQLRAYFPDGVDAPDLVLVKLQVENVEFWDSPNSPVSAAVSFVRTAMKGTSGWGGRHEHFDMPH